MKTVKYTKEADFICLEDLPGTSTELTLVHVGQENCKPYHIFSGKKDEYVLHFITSGRGFYSADGKAWPLTSGQMFLIYPDETVVYCSDSQEPWSYSWVGFSGFKAEYILKQCGFERDRLILSCPDASQLLSCFEEMFAHLTLDYSDALYRESVLLKLFSILCLHYTVCRDKNVPQDIPVNIYVRQAIEYINSTYMQSVTVSDISEYIGISRTHLNHVFQEEINLSVQNFLIDYRMCRAAGLLIHTSDSIKKISNQVGYRDSLVFSKAFKRKFGVSPKEYRINDQTRKSTLEIREKRP